MGQELPDVLPLWIIISAVVAGILLLGIIILILWKVRLQICTGGLHVIIVFLQIVAVNPSTCTVHLLVLSGLYVSC